MTADATHPPCYSAVVGAPQGKAESAAINRLRTGYEDGGWLSNLVWNTRNSYCAWPESTMPASQVRMLVEGFLAEVAHPNEVSWTDQVIGELHDALHAGGWRWVDLTSGERAAFRAATTPTLRALSDAGYAIVKRRTEDADDG